MSASSLMRCSHRGAFLDMEDRPLPSELRKERGSKRKKENKDPTYSYRVKK